MVARQSLVYLKFGVRHVAGLRLFLYANGLLLRLWRLATWRLIQHGILCIVYHMKITGQVPVPLHMVRCCNTVQNGPNFLQSY
jgi:hypothetical protein